MTAVRVAFKRLPEGDGLPSPAYMSEHAAGADLHAAVADDVTLPPGGARARSDGLLDRAAARLRGAGAPAQRPGDPQRRHVLELARNDRCRLSRSGVRRAWRTSVRSRSSCGAATASRRSSSRRFRAPPSMSSTNCRRPCAAAAASVRRRRMKIYIVGKGAVGSYFGELAEFGWARRDLRAAPPRRRRRTVRRRRCDRHDQVVRHRLRDRNAAPRDRASREVRLRLAAKRRRQRGETGGGVRRRQRRRGRADDAGRPRS